MDYYVYGLADPRDEKIMYVGITNDLYRRFMEHIIGRGKNASKNVWVRKLQSEGIIPSLKLIETVKTPDEARMREAHWIQHYGVKLLNIRRPEIRTPQEMHLLRQRRFLPARKKAPVLSTAPILIDWMGWKDIPALASFNQTIYDDPLLLKLGVYNKWLRKNPYLAMAAFDPKSDRQRMLAYVAALPLDEEVIFSVLRGEREEKDLLAEEMQTYDRPGGYTLLANSAVSLPEYPDLLNRVLLKLMDEWVDRYPERYITRIYSQTVSESGDRMAQHFFMAPRYDLAPNAYMLDFSRPGASRIIRRFQERLAQKAPLPEELRSPYDISA